MTFFPFDPVFEEDWEYQILDCLRERVTLEGWISVSNVKVWLADRLQIPNPPGEKWVGRFLNSQKFRHRRNPKSQYFMGPELVEDRFTRRYGELNINKVTEDTKTEKNQSNDSTLSNDSNDSNGSNDSAISAVTAVTEGDQTKNLNPCFRFRNVTLWFRNDLGG